MIAWINFIVLIISGLLMHILYLLSVRPAALEQKIGPKAYERSALYRKILGVFMLFITVNYVVYHWYPLPIDPFPATFSWPYWVSVLIAVVIAIPSGYLMWRSIKDAGEEALTPDKSHTMYSGIYQKIRHPMALGEVPLWWVIAFLVHSPFMVVFSFVWVPVWYWWCVAEEKDLLLRYGDAYAQYRQETGMFIPKRRDKFA